MNPIKTWLMASIGSSRMAWIQINSKQKYKV